MLLISQLWSKDIGTSFKGMCYSILEFKIQKKKHSPVQLRQRQQSRPRVNSH